MRIISTSTRKSFKPSVLCNMLLEAIAGWNGDSRASKRKAEAKAPRQWRSFGLEAIEPRLLLSADISYTYSAGDVAKFNDGDALNNYYRCVIEDSGGADVINVLAEDNSVLCSGILATGGINKVTLTGFEFLGDQLTVDFKGISGQDADKYDIEINMDGKGVIPLTGQDDRLEIVGDGGYLLDSLNVHAHEDITVTGKVIADGDITLKSSALDDKGLPKVDGLYFTADSLVTMSDANAELQGANITLLAESTITITNSNFSLGPVKAAFAIGNSSAAVNISNGVINASVNLNVEAKSTINSTLTTVPDDASDDDDTVDAAVASAVLSSTPTVAISGGDIDAGGIAIIKATNIVSASSTADGLTGDKGGTLAFNLLLGNTIAQVTGGTVDADSITIQAISDRTSTAVAKATVGGANSGGGSNESEKRLDDPNKDGDNSDKANTGEGDISFAAAVAVGVVTGDTQASITSGDVHASAGDLDLIASGKVTVTTTGDGSNKTGGGTAVGAAVAINVVTPNVTALLGGTADVDGTNINIKAVVPDSKVDAIATSGAGGTNLGVAGSLALNVTVLDAYATIEGDVQTNGADVNLTAESKTDSKAVAKAKVEGDGATTGVGASVAINIADNDTHARLGNGAILAGADDLSLTAKSDHGMVTEAKAGASGGDTSVAPVVAISMASYDTQAGLGTGGLLSVGGALSADAKHVGEVSTLADGEAKGADVAVGAVIAFGYSHDDVVATTLRDIAAAGGAVSFTANSVGQGTTRAKASASGAQNDGEDAQTKGDNKRTAGNQRATNSGAADSGTEKKAQAETPSESTSGSGDSIAVAAAIAFNIVDSESRAEIGDGRAITAGGVLTLRSGSNVDGTAIALGTAVDAGSVGVGAAVAVNAVDAQNTAHLGNSTVTADGLVAEALMADRTVKLQTATIPVVDTDKDTIFLGLDHELATGQEVEYKNGGGTSVGGLTDGTKYYVRDVGSGKIELYDTKAHAQDADSTTGRKDLTSAGSGSSHKLDLTGIGQGEEGFDPDPNSLRIIDVGANSGFSSGDEVVYHAGTGAAVGGLADGGTYYLIMLDDTHAQLASSYENAQKGTAIELTTDDIADDDFFTEATHSIRARAVSGAGSDDVGVAGSVAISRGEVLTTASMGADLTLADGNDGGSEIGALTITARATTVNEAKALPEGKGAVAESVGVGASFAMNVVLHDTTAEIGDSADISGLAGSVAVEANARHRSDTEARNGASGGTAVGGAAAVLISESDTKTRIGTSGTTLASSGNVSVTSEHRHDLLTKVSSEAQGSDASVGASVGVNYVRDTNLASIARNVAANGGNAVLQGKLTLSSTLDVHASAAGGKSTDTDDADTEAGDKTNNTSTAGGGHTNPKAKDKADDSKTSSQTESGSSNSGVGVAAAIAINGVTISNGASLTNGADLSATGTVSVGAQTSVDAKAQADAMSVNLGGSVNIGAAVALNFVSLTNSASVGTNSVVTGNGVTVEAVTTGSDRNDYVATAFTAAGNKGGDASIAGAIAVNAIDVETSATVADGATIDSAGVVTLEAEHVMGLQAIAASGAVSGDNGFGAAVAVNLIGDGTGGSNTIASLGTADGDDVGATVHADGVVSVKATHSLGMTGTIDLPAAINSGAGISDPSISIGSIAVAGAAGSGGNGIAGSAAYDRFTTTTRATVERGSIVDGHSGAAAGALSVTATDTTNWTSVVGSIGVGLDGAGFGAGLEIAVIHKDTRAYIGRAADVTTSGTVTLAATSSEDLLGIAGNAGIGGSTAGIAGSASVHSVDMGTRAYVENATAPSNAASVTAGGNVSITSSDTFTDKLIGASLGVGSSVGAGAANATLIITDTVEAYVGDGAFVASTSGDMAVDAQSSISLLGITATAGVAGSLALGGSVTVGMIHQYTDAWIGRGATADAGGSMLVHANASTTVTDVAGSLTASGSAAVGVGVDGVSITKITRAFIDSGVNSDVDGDLRVIATSSEDITSVVAGFAASGGASVSANPSITFLDITTKAHIGDDPSAGPSSLGAGNVDVEGSILISADDVTEIDKVSAGAAAGVAGVGLAASVTSIDKHTHAFIGTDAQVTARGNGAGVDSALGIITESTVASTPGTASIEANSSGTYNGNAASVGAAAEVGAPKIGSGTNDGPSAAKSSVEVTRSNGRAHNTVNGIAISATNSDDLETYSLAVGAGSVGVAVSGAVNVVTTDTRAFVTEDATVNQSLSGANGAQSVRIGAGNDFHHVAVTASAAGGFVGVAPGLDMTITDATVVAEIGDGALVKATNDVTVDALNAEDVVVVTIGLAGGAVGVGAGLSYVSITADTEARIGDATVSAGDSVRVLANADSEIVLVDGAAGGGFVGGGAGVGVVLVDKTTHAIIDDGAIVDATGSGSGFGGTLTGDLSGGDAANGFDKATVGGVVVQATSSEDLLHVAVAAGGGFVGIAGAIAGTVMDSDTLAEIGNADINLNTVSATQNVYVNAGNETRLHTIVGALSGGVVGVGGAVDIGVIRNDVGAKIRGGANVSAGNDVEVNALAIKELDGFTASASGGVVGLGAAVAVWSVGTPIDQDYNGQKPAESGGVSAQDDAGHQSSNALNQSNAMWSGYGSVPVDDSNPANRSRTETSSAMSNALTKVNNSNRPTYSDGGTAGDPSDDTSTVSSGVESADPTAGTEAVIESSATVTAGASLLAVGDLRVNAKADVEIDMSIGQIAVGLVGAGAAVGIVAVNEAVTASAGGTLKADGGIYVDSALDTDFHFTSVAGQGGIVGLGASVVVLSDTSAVKAEIGNNATIDSAGSVHVNALTHRDITSTNIGVQVAGVAVGASFSDVTIGGSVTARVGSNAQVGQGTGTVGSLEVRADANDTATIDTTALVGGVGAATANYGYATINPSVTAEIGAGADVKVVGNATVDAVSHLDGDSDVLGVSVGGGALAASIANVNITPTVTAATRSNATLRSTSGAARVRASHNETGGLIATANTVAGSGGVISGSGSSSTVTHSAIVSAVGESGSELRASGDAELRAYSGAKADTDAGSLGVGVATIGTSVANSTVGGSLTADFQGAVLGGGGSNVFVRALSDLSADTVTVATTGGVLGGSTNQATAQVNTGITARVGAATVNVSGNVTINADADARATADSGGIETGDGDFPNLSILGGIGLSASDATLDSTVSAEIGAANVNAGGTLLVKASHNESNSQRAKATSSASGGSLGVSLSGADSDANSTADTYANAGGAGATLHAGGGVFITAANNNQAEAITDALGLGLVAGIGASHSTAITQGHSEARIVDGSGSAANQKTTVTGGGLSVNAVAMDRARAVANGAAGGLFAGGSFNEAEATIAPTVIAEIGKYADVDVSGAVSVIADSAAEGDAATEGTQGSAGLTIGDSNAYVNLGNYPSNGDRIRVAATIDDSATVDAGSVDVEALFNDDSSIADLQSVFGGTTNGQSKASANASGGGLLAGISSADAATNIRTDVDASVNAGASVTAANFIIVNSLSQANGAARGVSFQGGAGAFGTGHANVRIAQDVDTNVGANATLTAGGSVQLSTEEASSTDTYGASAGGGIIAAGDADAISDIKSAANVNVGNGAQITAGGDIFVYASQYFEGSGYATAESYGAGADAYASIQFTVSSPVVNKATAGINIGQDATLYAKDTLTLDVEVDGGTIAGHGFSQIIALAGDADTDVITQLNTLARIDIKTGAALTGEDKVDMLARHQGVYQDSGDFNGDTGIRAFGYSIGAGDARFTYHLIQPTYIVAADGATIASRDLLVRTLNDAPGFSVSMDEDGLNLLDWEEFHGDWSPDRQINWNADVVLLSGAVPELEVRSDGYIEKAVNVSVNDGGVTKGQGDFITNAEFQVNNIYNNNPGHAKFEANPVSNVFSDVEFEDLGPFDGEADTHPTSQIYGNDGTWYARRTFDTVTLINHSAKKMIVNDIMPIDRDGDPDGEAFINVADRAPGGKDPFNFEIVNQFEPSVITIESTSTSNVADVQFNGVIDNPIGSTIVTSGSDILSDGSQLIRTNIGDFTATDDIGLLVGNVGAGGTRTALRVDLVQSTGRPENLDATAEGNIVLDIRGVNRTTGGGSFTSDIGTLDAGANVDVFLINGIDETNPPASVGSYALIIDENNNGGVDDDGTTNTPNPTPYIQFFKPDTGSDIVFDYWKNLTAPLGVFGTYKQDVEVTYDFELVQAGRVSGGSDIQLNGQLTGADVNIVANTNIFGSGSGVLYALTDGDISLEETTGDMRLGRIKSNEGDVTLTADADGDYDIIDVESDDHLSTGNDATADADVTGRSITLYALNGYIGEPCLLNGLIPVDFVEINSSFSGTGVVNATAQKDIYLDEISGNLNLGLVTSVDTDVDLHTRAGGITDGNGAANNIEAHSIDLVTVGGGVGASGNDVEIDTDNATGGATDGRLLVVSTANGAGDASIYITETDEALDVLRATTDKGDVRLSVPDEADSGENFVLLANGETLECVILGEGRIQAERDVALRVGDNVDIVSGTTDFILAGRNIDIFGDWGNADAGVGTVMNLRGEITSDFGSPANAKQVGERTAIFGHTDNDTFNYLQTKLGGDTYNYGSQNPTASQADDGEDFFFVDRLQTLDTVRGTYTDSQSNVLGMRDALTLDGQADTDAYLVVTHGSINGNGGLGGISDYVVNTLDTGAANDGVDTLTIKGSDDADVFLLRGQSYIPGHDDGLNSPASSPSTSPVLNPAFVALLHGDLENDIRALGGDPDAQAANPTSPYLKVERVNYDQAMNGRLIVYGYEGNDYFASDDNSVITTLDGGGGHDRFQIGQLFRSEREYGNVADANDFAAGTALTTRGYLSRGISAPMTIYGGTGNDDFSVYSNKAELRLEGNEGNDEFIIRAFALETGQGGDGQTLIKGGEGDDNIQYNINAPVSIDGGPGFDRVVVLGTEFADNFVITEDGIFGAGLNVKMAGNEEMREIDGLEGDDNFWVLGTPFDAATRVIGGLGSDDVNAMGDVTGVVISHSLEGLSSTIEHQVTANPLTDPFYNNMLARGVDLNIATANSGKIVIDEPDGRTVVSESSLLGSTTDSYQVYLAAAPGAAVHVTVSAVRSPQQEQDGLPAGDTFLVSTDGVNFSRAIVLTFNAGEYGAAKAQTVWVKAVNDARPEGPRTAVISHSSISADAAFNFVQVRNVEVDIIDDDKADIIVQESFAEYDNGTQVLEGALPQGINDTYTVRLGTAPTGTTIVQLTFDATDIGVTTADSRYDSSTKRITFSAANWYIPVSFTIAAVDDVDLRENREIVPVTHSIVSSADARYDDGNAATVEVAPTKLKVSVLDNDSEGVIVTESFGSTLVVQDKNLLDGDQSESDTYTVRLSKAPVGDVTITTVPLMRPDADGGMVQTVFTLPTALVFNSSNWWVAQEVTITANPDFDPAPGTEDYMYFAKRDHRVSELFGPLEILGGVGPEDRSLVEAVLLPGETNSLASDGNVVSYSGSFTPGAIDTMIVEAADLQAVADAVPTDDVSVLADLVGFTLQISKGPGLDRFWRINAVTDIGGGQIQLTLENPGRLEEHWNENGAPTSASEYAVNALSANFFVDETTQIDKVNVFNDTSVADDTGTLTSTLLSGLGMGPGVAFDTNEDNIADLFFASGISYATFNDGDPSTTDWYKDVEILDLMLGRGNDMLTINSTLQTTADHGGITVVHGGGNTPVGPAIGGDTIVVNARAGGSPLVVFGDTSADGYRYSGQSGQKSPNAMNFAVAGRDVLDASASGESVTLYGGGDNDLIIGSSVGDHLAGGSGDDRIFGLGGNDHIYGDSGVNIDVETRKLVSGMTGPALQDVAFSASNPLVELTGHDRSQRYDGFQADDLTATAVDLSRPTWADSLDGGADLILGGLDNDIVFGDHGIITQFWAASIPAAVRITGTGSGAFGTANERLIESRSNANGKTDTIFGNEGDDVLIGGAAGDNIDGNTARDLIFGDNASLDRTGYVGDATNPRFRVLSGTQLYSATDAVLVTSAWQPDPTSTPVWTDLHITPLNHSFADEAAGLNNFGNDYIAGGANNDQMFGELGNDVIQGDGSIGTFTPGAGALLRQQLGAGTVALTSYGAGRAPGVDSRFENALTVTPSFEAATDGDDYIEGNGGNDVVFGNLGQDDVIGGSSNVFGLDTSAKRPDGDDLIFGGAGTDISRNDAGDATSHSRDSDSIAADNGNIFRIRGVNNALGGDGVVAESDGYLNFNYDIYTSALTSSLRANVAGTDDRIIVRTVDLLDYTPGGPDYDTAALSNIGGSDEVHGESGDDFIYGMVGNDALFGEGQDDDLLGGWGADWISGGTGEDGAIGDDGRLWTSRNSAQYGEPLYGIATLLANDPNAKNINGNVLNEYVYTPGSVQTAILNIAGDLKKSVNLTPFNADPAGSGGGVQDPLFAPTHLNDVIFGGMGTDWLHGGAGDDAISGSEALPEAYTQNWDDSDPDNPALAGVMRSDYTRPYNNGDMLRFNPVDDDGWHFDPTRRAGEFALYDEYDALRKIELNGDGTANKTATGLEWFLNFDPAEPGESGTVTVGTNTMTKTDDAILGDLGNDWMVGGLGRDDLYGGYGNDLINADDDHRTHGELNDQPDTGATQEDRVYGGAGRDVLIGNTGGDRLIDWVGEFNSYLVPFAPFGTATVSRTLQPQLPEYLYALSRSDGADATRAADTGTEAERNGEPEGELGLNMPQDPDFHDQTGAPADPQAGNIPGGTRDVLRSASFNDGQTQGLMADSGTWQVSSGALQVSAKSLHGDAVAVYFIGDALPSYFEVKAAIKVLKPTAGWTANSYIIFDYVSYQDFKFAGIDISTNKIVIGHRNASGWIVDTQTPFQAKPDIYYNMLLSVNGTSVTLVANGTTSVSFKYAPRVMEGVSYGLNWGMVGFGSNNSRGAMDNIAVQVLPPQGTFVATEEFTSGAGAMFAAADAVGTWSASAGRYAGTPLSAADYATSLMNLGGVTNVEANSALNLASTFKTSTSAGFIFDRYAEDDFKFAVIDVGAQKIVIGHYTATSGWVVDASASKNLSAGVDYQAALSLRGSKVSFTVNGTVLSYSFNGSTVDGRFGLLAKGSAASFDKVYVLTDDPVFAAPPAVALMAAGAPDAAGTSTSALDVTAIDAVLTEAERRWATSGLVDEQAVTDLGTIQLRIADLQGLTLAMADAANNTIIIDANAAGYGWFIDPTLTQDEEFTRRLSGDELMATPASDAYGRVDLLTVLEHELGHLLGFGHETVDVMDETLAAGIRITPQVYGTVPALLPSSAAIGVAGNFAAVPAAASAPAPVIDWEGGYLDQARRKIASDDGPSWLGDFVNHLGRSESQRNANAGLRVHLPAVSKAAETVSLL